MEKIKPLVLGTSTVDEAMLYYDEILKFCDYSGSICIDNINKQFFIDPASSKYHNCEKYGLLFHSINVAFFAYKFINTIKVNGLYKLDIDFEKYVKETVIAGLFHDYDKVGRYEDEEPLTDKQIYRIEQDCLKFNLNSKEILPKLGKSSGSSFIDAISKGDLESIKDLKKQYKYINRFEIGHGEGSIIKLLQIGFVLSEHQMLSIRFHMMGLDCEWSLPQRQKIFMDYLDKVPMLRAIYMADLYTGLMFE